jgi:hypothetical protein
MQDDHADDPQFQPGGLFGDPLPEPEPEPPPEPWLSKPVDRDTQARFLTKALSSAANTLRTSVDPEQKISNFIETWGVCGFNPDWIRATLPTLMQMTPEELGAWSDARLSEMVAFQRQAELTSSTAYKDAIRAGASKAEALSAAVHAATAAVLGVAPKVSREAKLRRAFNPFLRASAPPFDPEAWPVAVRNYARQQNERSGIDATAIAFGALFSAASAIHPKSRIALRPEGNWYEAPVLWVGLFADSGANKSYVHRDVKRHASAREARERQRWAEASAKIEKDFEDIEKPTKAQETAKEKALAAIAPIRAYAPDGTPEAMQDIMRRPAQKGWGLGVIVDEMLGHLKSIEHNRSGKHFLAGYDCPENYNADRVVRGSFTIPVWALGMFGGLQIEKMLKGRENYAADGMLQRFIPVFMAKAQRVDPVNLAKYKGTPVTSDDSAIAKAIEASYERDPATFTLTDEARAIFDAHDNHALDVAEGLGETPFRSFVDKMRGTWGRIVAAMHILEGKDPGTPIGANTATRTTRLMERTIWQHGDLLYSLLDEGRADEARQEAAEVLLRLEAEGRRTVSVSDLAHAGRAWRFKDPRDRDRMLDLFMAGGWIEELNTSQMPTRTRQFEIVEGLAAHFDVELKAYRTRVAAAIKAIRAATGWDVKTPGWAEGEPKDGA